MVYLFPCYLWLELGSVRLEVSSVNSAPQKYYLPRFVVVMTGKKSNLYDKVWKDFSKKDLTRG